MRRMSRIEPITRTSNSAWATPLGRGVGEAGRDQRRAELGLAPRPGSARRCGVAPPPRVAAKASPWSGSWTTPTTVSPSTSHGDRDREAGVAVEVVGGPVDRVDEPPHAACALDARPLLADDAVVGSRPRDPVDDQPLAGLVDLGDHVGRRRLRAHLDRGSSSRARAAPRRPRRAPRERKQFLERLAHHSNARRTRRSGRSRCRHAPLVCSRARWPPTRSASPAAPRAPTSCPPPPFARRRPGARRRLGAGALLRDRDRPSRPLRVDRRAPRRSTPGR